MANKEHSISTPCPVCKGDMIVKELECPSCEITVRGNFGTIESAKSGGRFGALNGDQMIFLETFLRCRGIIRDVEAALGISYPTVRARLDSLISTLGLNSDGVQGEAASKPIEPVKPSIKDILSKLDSGSIDAQSALDALRGAQPSAKNRNS